MNATVWIQDGCHACREERTLLLAEGYTVDVIVVDDPDGMDRDAFAQLHCQDGMFPVVRVGGVFRVPAVVLKHMEW